MPSQDSQAPTGHAPSSLLRLEDLRGLRSAPLLEEPARRQLRAALIAALQPCSWFTIGVMAPSADQAVRTLRRWEAVLAWTPLQAAEGSASVADGPVFLKGNQHSGSYRLRQESGLGCGVLVSGHNPDDPSVEDTWGPFPLDLLD